MDHLTPVKRSQLMARVRGKDTRPEMVVRRAAHSMGFRFRLHRKDLPGKPDLVFPLYRTVVFVHGCFWHRHAGCKKATDPKSNINFWSAKFSRNADRDRCNVEMLLNMGWNVAIIWECQTKSLDVITSILEDMRELLSDDALVFSVGKLLHDD